MSKIHNTLKGDQKCQAGCWGTTGNFERMIRLILIDIMTGEEQEASRKSKPRWYLEDILHKGRTTTKILRQGGQCS